MTQQQPSKWEETRNEWKYWCNTDNLSAPPTSETDRIADWWLKVLSNREAELVKKIKAMKERVPKTSGFINTEVYRKRACNKVISNILELFKQK